VHVDTDSIPNNPTVPPASGSTPTTHAQPAPAFRRKP